jgi:hypothetical protein
MALVYIDSFSTYAKEDNIRAYNWSYGGFTQPFDVSPTLGRRQSGGLKCNYIYGSALQFRFPTSEGYIMGIAAKLPPSGDTNIIRISDPDNTAHFSLRVNPDGSLSINKSTGEVSRSASNIVKTNVWNYIELKFQISDYILADTCIVRLNEEVVINVPESTSIASTTNQYASFIEIIGPSGSEYCDFYVCDYYGTTNNDFLGDCRVEAIRPMTDGTYSDGVTSVDGAAHFEMVGEVNYDQDTYVTLNTSGSRESYGMSELPYITPQTIYGIQTSAVLSKADSGYKAAAPFIRVNTTDSDGVPVALGTSWQNISVIHETDPTTSAAWEIDAINDIEAGVVVS